MHPKYCVHGQHHSKAIPRHEAVKAGDSGSFFHRENPMHEFSDLENIYKEEGVRYNSSESELYLPFLPTFHSTLTSHSLHHLAHMPSIYHAPTNHAVAEPMYVAS